MNIQILKSIWGMSGEMEEQFAQMAAAGYNGIEHTPLEGADITRFRRLAEQYDFTTAVLCFANNEAEAEYAILKAAELNPRVIVIHSAKDSMSWDDQRRYFEHALRIEEKAGIPVAHETHRGRAMFTPWHTAQLLTHYKELKIAADFSHWVCVCESLLEDHAAALELACERAIHIHARVGFAEGPQVPDPSAPEYALERQAHYDWWKRIVTLHTERGKQALTITPEFGPIPYMHAVPHTRTPLADLWDVCDWMKQDLRRELSLLPGVTCEVRK
ncbi:sugar phosphate isomerase/epimerase family protein [Paenibacillus gansuensis]|uniref:Sugar phosphate isomerase/epimerase family protein n=1 Tax=Paenibacillus gansuensis TaxID=306542 RepID=A0ABW5PJ65_9BACL